jgi:hypothetical protein
MFSIGMKLESGNGKKKHYGVELWRRRAMYQGHAGEQVDSKAKDL